MYHGNGFLAGRCVIPIRDEKSQLVAYAGRAVNGEEPKYRFPAGFRKSQVLFNLDRAMPTGGRNVIVVEGFFDALKVHQAGHPAVVALMGASFSQRQSELLLSHFASVTLMLDGDEPGRRAAEVHRTATDAESACPQSGTAKPCATGPTVVSGNQCSCWSAQLYLLIEFPSSLDGIPSLPIQPGILSHRAAV